MTSAAHALRFPQPLRDVRRVTLQSQREALARHAAELPQREQAAFERGRREGEKALSEQLLQQRAELVELQGGVLAALRQAVPQVIKETEQTLTTLALEVAQKLVAGLPISAEMIAAAVREAMSQIEENTEFHLYVHPEDLELLRRANSDLLEPSADHKSVAFHPTPEVSRGGCLVKTRFGIIDGQRENKLEMIRKAVVA